MTQQTIDFSGQTALITGANRGIGLELARQLKASGARVIGAHRGEDSEPLDALGVERLAGVDVCDAEVKARLHSGLETLGVQTLNLLINNAGLLERDELGSVDFDGVRRQLEVNTLGPLRVSESLISYLKAGSVIANISSRMGSIEDNTSGGFYGYRASKAALNAVTKSLALDLAPKGVSVVALHPGFVQTDMTGGRGLIGPAESAGGLLERISLISEELTGTFWHMDGGALPW